MDKQTLSNYGWIVVCILVISVMLALATPFGEFIAGGFKATYVGFSHTADAAFGVIGLGNGGAGGGEQGGSGDEGQTPTDPITDLTVVITTMDDGWGDTYFIANRPIADDEKIPVSWSDGLTLSDNVIATGSNTGYIDPAAFEEMDIGEDVPYYVAIVQHDKWVYDYTGAIWDGSSVIPLIEQVEFNYGADEISMSSGTNKTKFTIIYEEGTPNDEILNNPNVSWEDNVATFYLDPNTSMNIGTIEDVGFNTYIIPCEGNDAIVNSGHIEAAYVIEKGETCVTWFFIFSDTYTSDGGAGGSDGIVDIDLGIINNNTLIITPPVAPVDTYEIYVNDELVATTSETTFDLSAYLTQPGEISINVLGYHEGVTVAASMIFFQYIPGFEFEIVGTDVNILNAHPDVTYALIINGEEVGDFDNGTISLLYRGLENGVDYEISVVARYSYFDGLYSGTVTYTHSEPTSACTHENVHAQDMGWALVGNHELYCDDCGEYVSVEAHYDNDQDGTCDGCGSSDVN